MAISINSTTAAETALVNTTSQSVVLNVADGSNRLLLLGVTLNLTNNESVVGTVDASFGGIPLDVAVMTSGGAGAAYWFYQVNPETGSQTASWTLVGETSAGMKMVVICLDGAAQSAPATSTAQHITFGAATSASSLAITPVADNSWIFDHFSNFNGAATVSQGSAQNLVVADLTGTSFTMGISYESQSGSPVEATMSWVASLTNRMDQVVIAISPFVVAVSSIPRWPAYNGFWGATA